MMAGLPSVKTVKRCALGPVFISPVVPRIHHFAPAFAVDPEPPVQFRERSLRTPYRGSNGVRGRGAAMTHLSPGTFLHASERVKQLVYRDWLLALPAQGPSA
jgi:hypothetical protein